MHQPVSAPVRLCINLMVRGLCVHPFRMSIRYSMYLFAYISIYFLPASLFVYISFCLSAQIFPRPHFEDANSKLFRSKQSWSERFPSNTEFQFNEEEPLVRDFLPKWYLKPSKWSFGIRILMTSPNMTWSYHFRSFLCLKILCLP